VAYREEQAGGPRRDTPAVFALPLPGATALREAVAAFGRSTVANRYFEEVEELEEALVKRCVTLLDQPEHIRSYIRYHWWPEAA